MNKVPIENQKMRFVLGPTSVIEEALLVGFVGKKEQTGHPSQKPEKVYEKLILMSSKAGDLICYDRNIHQQNRSVNPPIYLWTLVNH